MEAFLTVGQDEGTPSSLWASTPLTQRQTGLRPAQAGRSVPEHHHQIPRRRILALALPPGDAVTAPQTHRPSSRPFPELPGEAAGRILHYFFPKGVWSSHVHRTHAHTHTHTLPSLWSQTVPVPSLSELPAANHLKPHRLHEAKAGFRAARTVYDFV